MKTQSTFIKARYAIIGFIFIVLMGCQQENTNEISSVTVKENDKDFVKSFGWEIERISQVYEYGYMKNLEKNERRIEK